MNGTCLCTAFCAPLATVIEGDQEDHQDGETTQDGAEHDVKSVVRDGRI